MSSFRKHIFILFCLFVGLLQFVQILYFQRSFFTERYDATYWKDRFEHSQWELPLSQRIIGDDGIYAYAGYQMMHGVSIDATNANKPPVGLYLISLSIALFGNAAWLLFATGIATLVLF